MRSADPHSVYTLASCQFATRSTGTLTVDCSVWDSAGGSGMLDSCNVPLRVCSADNEEAVV